jgi:CRP/FNR family transcriptional regulator, cyclic AMP receptor protein
MRMRRPRTVELLGNVSLFSACSDRELDHIARLVRERRVPSGTVLVREGEAAGDELLIVAEGLAEVAAEGQRLASIGPGAFIGEVSMLDGAPRSATVTTVAPTRLLVLDAAGFDQLLARSPDVANRVLRVMAARLRAADEAAAAS